MSLADRLEAATAETDKLLQAANDVLQVADRIKDAVGLPYRMPWAQPASEAKEVFTEHRMLLKKSAERIRELSAAVNSSR